MLAREKRVLVLALRGQGIEADKRLVDKTGMAHHEAAFRQALEELPHQRTKLRRLRKIIGAGEARIERNIRCRRTLAKLRAQDVEHQRLGRTEPLPHRLIASALTAPAAR